MRPVLQSDLTAAARVLLALPEPDRAQGLRSMFAMAQVADLYRKRMGRVHPFWGNGSLMSVARMAAFPPDPGLKDPDYLQCIAIVISELIARSCAHTSRRRTKSRSSRLSR